LAYDKHLISTEWKRKRFDGTTDVFIYPFGAGTHARFGDHIDVVVA